MKSSHESGMVHPLLLSTIVLAVLTTGLGGFSIWSFVNYLDQKNNTDAKISAAVATAKTQQTTVDQAAFAEQEKAPNRQIIGPVDLGQVTFSYPKTWSVYVDKSSAAGYEAYFHPLVVPGTTTGTAYALRVSIIDNKYESVLGSFNERIKAGQLKASPITLANVDGTRLDGAFSSTVRGSMVLFKIRDKTLEVYTQAEVYKNDFDNIILKSLQFNK